MNVKELIEKLNKFPQEAVIYSCWDDISKPDVPLLDVHEGFPTPRLPEDETHPTAVTIGDINYNSLSVLLITKDYSNLVSDSEWKSPEKETFDEMMIRYSKRRSARPKDLAPWPSLAQEILIYKENMKKNKLFNQELEGSSFLKYVLESKKDTETESDASNKRLKNILDELNTAVESLEEKTYDKDDLFHMDKMYGSMNKEELKAHNSSIQKALDKKLSEPEETSDKLEEYESCLEVNDLSDKFLPLLPEELRNAIQNKVTQQLSFDHICKYHSVVIKKGEIEKGITKLVEDITTVNEKTKIIGCLSPCSSLKLHVGTETDILELSEAVFVFIAIKLEDSDEYDRLFQGKLFSSILEGIVGNKLD